MANLSSLVHKLRERIAASSSTPPNIRNDDALELRFRAVLPNLLNAYVVPSSSANGREVSAVLKLIAHTAKNFPGVFYHGKAGAVLPVVGRILPFLAEPAFRVNEDVGSYLLELPAKMKARWEKHQVELNEKDVFATNVVVGHN